jgi:hypothetical protein
VCLSAIIPVHGCHIPGKQNFVADYLYRFMFLLRPLDIDYAEGEEEVEQLGAHILLAVMNQQQQAMQ